MLDAVLSKAFATELELEGGKAVIEVSVFSEGKVFDVEINSATGEILEVEEEDDEDDDEDDD